MEESGDAMDFVANWVGGTYSPDLSSSAMYNDLHNLFRNKYGRNALGLRNALQHYVKLGSVEAAKGTGYSQMYTIAGATQAEPEEVHTLPTDDVVSRNHGLTDNPQANDQPSTKYPQF